MKKLKCHCGQVEAEININKEFEKILRCNCSICKRKGAIMSMVKNEDFIITKGENKLSLYQFEINFTWFQNCSNTLRPENCKLFGSCKILKLC